MQIRTDVLGTLYIFPWYVMRKILYIIATICYEELAPDKEILLGDFLPFEHTIRQRDGSGHYSI